MISAKYQPWHKRVLIPFWVIQVCFVLWLVVSSSIVLQYTRSALETGTVLVLSICWISLFLNVIEIILFSAGKLKPLFYLISQIIKTTLWLIIFVIDMVALADNAGRYRISTAFAVRIAKLTITLLSFVATLIYASVTYRRARLGRVDRTHSSRPSQDAPHKRENEFSTTRQPAPAHVTINAIGNEHGHAAVFEMGGSSHTPPPHELQTENKRSSMILDGRER